MSGVFGNPWLYNADDSFYSETIDQSLRFDNGDSAKLYFDPTQDGDKQKFTWSGWVKRGNLGLDYAVIFSGVNSSGHQTDIRFEGEDTLRLITATSVLSMNVITNRLFRDTTSWYHIVVAIDTTQSTLTNRFKVYVNGVQETSFSSSVCGENHNCVVNTASNTTHNVGANGYDTSVSSEFDGYLAEVNFIDGAQLTPDNFGETKDGIWIPKLFSGSYGVNGFYLTFQGTGTATTSQGTTAQLNIGDDQSGAGHNFTVINSVASDVVSDSPTNNFCTLNPLTHGTYPTLSEGNLKIASVYGADISGVASTWFPTTGKWYWEVHNEGAASTYPYLGITDQKKVLTNATTGSYYSVAWLRTGGSAAMTGTNTYMGTITKNNVTSWTNNDIIMFALDVDARKLWIGKNGTWDSSGDPAGGSGEDASWTVDTGVSPSFMGYSGQGLGCVFNFGQDGTFADNQTAQGNADGNGVGDFYYSPPSGFLAMATSNLPQASISPKGDSLAGDHFNAVLYTGESDDDVTATNTFAADWVWLKCRNNTDNPYMQDAVRGFGASKSLSSSTTGTEGYNGGAPSSQNIVVTDTSIQFLGDDFTKDSRPFVAWTWKAGGATPTKTYKVRVDDDGGQNKYRFRNSADDATFTTYAPTVDLQEGGTYVFDWSDGTAQGHPIRFSTTSDGTHGGGSEYTTGVVKDDSAYTTTITVAAGAPALYYYCQIHSGMGGAVNTNSTYGSTNFDGSSLAVVSANQAAGFSVLTYTGTGSNATIPHGLSSPPSYIIVKGTDDSRQWIIGSDGLTDWNEYLLFTSSNGEAASSDVWNSTAPTSSVFSVGSNINTNKININFVAYCFHSVDQYCKVGTFEGNSSSNGTFVFCNFRPKFIIIKGIDQGSDWAFYDDQRQGYNVDNDILRVNAAATEQTDNDIDILSNGFKLRRSSPTFNQSTLVFIAWASQPFKFSNAR